MHAQQEGHVSTQGEGSPLQAKERGLKGNQTYLVWASSLQNYEKINTCWLSHQSGILLLQLEHTKTPSVAEA